MIRVLADGIIYGKQARGGVGRCFEELFHRIAANPEYATEIHLLLPEKVQRLPEALNESERLRHIAPSFPSLPDGILSKTLRRIAKAPGEANMTRRLRELAPQIFHSTYYTDPPIPDMRVVVTVHDFIDAHTFESMSGNPPNFTRAMRKSIEEADAVVAVSHSTKEDILRFTSAKADNITVIPHAASDTFNADEVTDDDVAKIKRDYGIEGPYWFFVGRRNPYKNFNALLRAWKLFRDETGIDSWLVVTGAYGDLERFEIAYLMEHGLETRLVMTRTVDDQRLRSLYRGAAAFIFPSLYEGFGIPVLEAFACRTPCILADTRVFREVAQDAALYFEPYSDESFAKQMTQALDPDMRDGLIAKGSERLKAYSWDESARQLAELYSRLV